MSKKTLHYPIQLFVLAASCVLMTKTPAAAFELTFSGAIGEVNNVPATNSINTTTTSNTNGLNGFNNFFTDDFLLLGSDSSDANIPSDSFKTGLSLATSSKIVINSGDINKDLVLNFDWTFQGNSDRVLTLGQSLDLFTVALVGTGSVNGLSQSLLNTTTYASNLQQSLTIPKNTLLAGTYVVEANLVESINLITDPKNILKTIDSSSAAGIGNFTAELEVPFEFSPTTGLLLVGGFWGCSQLGKRQKKTTTSLIN